MSEQISVVDDDIKRISEAALVATYDGGTAAIKQVNNIQASITVIVRYVYVASIGGECETAGKSGSRNTVFLVIVLQSVAANEENVKALSIASETNVKTARNRTELRGASPDRQSGPVIRQERVE